MNKLILTVSGVTRSFLSLMFESTSTPHELLCHTRQLTDPSACVL